MAGEGARLGPQGGAVQQELDAIRGAIAPALPMEPPDETGSAVLAPIVASDQQLFFLFERRPPGPSRFAGHLSFPGGRFEPDDATTLETALREAEEEVGFTARDVEVVGHLVDTDDPLGRHVSCFVGIVPLAAIPDHPASPDEVAELILVPFVDLRVPGGKVEEARWPRHGYRAVAYESRLLPSEEHLVQYWHLEAVHGRREATLWGFTGGLVARFLHQVHAWSPPASPRIVERWEDLVPGALRQ